MALNWEKFVGSFQPGKNHPDLPPLRDVSFKFTKVANRAQPTSEQHNSCEGNKHNTIACRYKGQCSRHKRVQKYLSDKSNPVSTEDMKHCEKFTHSG